RFFRIYPLHLVMLAVMLGLELAKLLASQKAGFTFNHPPFSAENAPSQILPNLLLLHSWTPYTDSLSFNYPSWSISIEFYMYIALFVSVILFRNHKALVWFTVSCSML